MITVDLLMSTKPCERWPRERVEELLARPEIDRSSWVRFAESCIAADAVSIEDLRLTAYRAATPAQRLLGVQRSIRVHVASQMVRWPVVSDSVAVVRADLLRWASGDNLDIEDVWRRSRGAHHVASRAVYRAATSAAAYVSAAAHVASRDEVAACAVSGAASRATTYASSDSADAAASYAAGAAYAAAYDAAYAAAAEAREALAGLMFICGVLDGEVQP